MVFSEVAVVPIWWMSDVTGAAVKNVGVRPKWGSSGLHTGAFPVHVVPLGEETDFAEVCQ